MQFIGTCHNLVFDGHTVILHDSIFLRTLTILRYTIQFKCTLNHLVRVKTALTWVIHPKHDMGDSPNWVNPHSQNLENGYQKCVPQGKRTDSETPKTGKRGGIPKMREPQV